MVGSASVKSADASAGVAVTGRRIISSDHSGRGNVTGCSCSYSSSFGCARRLCAGRSGARGGAGGVGVGDGELGGVIRLAVSIVSCQKLLHR